MKHYDIGKLYQIKEKGTLKDKCAITKTEADAIIVNNYGYEIPVNLNLFDIVDNMTARYIGINAKLTLTPKDIELIIDALSYQYDMTDGTAEHEENMNVVRKIKEQMPANISQYNDNFL